ncbi:MAG: V-type ATP synthase subunit A [Thermoplasmata archaeon]|nr:V-type ATP synthase subunit A [Thermoplasmata archaeon]
MGIIYRVSGPVVVAKDVENAKMYDVVYVGEEGLVGEIIRITGNSSIIQVYEDTSGVKPNDKVVNTELPLSVEIGPGLLKSIYDGVQRPLPILKEKSGDFIKRGITANALDENKKWYFVPTAKVGDNVSQGSIVGYVQESQTIKTKIMVPKGVNGKIKEISEGNYTIRDHVYSVESNGRTIDLGLSEKSNVRFPRSIKEKLPPTAPLITGQRVIDTFFTVAKGGTACVIGPFGSGKTVIQHQLAKWSDTDIVVYVGCGERGNEMTEVLVTFPELIDPKTKGPLMDRTVLIANTSNMPVAAREASVYTAVTIAEYYRDMGYDVSLMADSTSRWAEAMREISGRLEEMPGEEGYPAYLSRRLAEFYERAGRTINLNGTQGSVTIVGAVSPPGGDTSEPVSQGTLRLTKVFWALDASLANRRHFPSLNWLTSYSQYHNTVGTWFSKNVSPDWNDIRDNAMSLLQQEEELQEIVQLVGPDALPDRERIILDTAKMIREDYLQQSAFDEVDTYCSLKKQNLMLKTILLFHQEAMNAISSGIPLKSILSLKVRDQISRMKEIREENLDQINQIMDEIKKEFNSLKGA